MIWIEYGLQSSHDRTLSLINRGHDAAAFTRAVEMTRGRGIYICAHIILGLPGETGEEMLETADVVADLDLSGIKLHLLYVVKETPLEGLFNMGEYTCLTQEEYVKMVCDVLVRLPSGMVIQRLTGDPHPGELVAPAWALQKRETLSKIEHYLLVNDLWQGKERDAFQSLPFKKAFP